MADGRLLFRRVRHGIEAVAIYGAFGLFRLLPLGFASAIGGWLGRRLGPWLRPSGIARRNLAATFPEKTPAEIEAIVAAMWENLGRVGAEYPHVARLRVYEPDGAVEVVGAEILDRLRDDGRPAVLFSGHLANWEVIRPALVQRGLVFAAAYRAANNPWVDSLIFHGRRDMTGPLIPKGGQGARMALKTLKSRQHLAMFVDQKMNDGIAVPFFGRDAMTATAAVDLARKFECPLVPVRIERLGGARFRVTVEEPLDLPLSRDRHADIRAGTIRINQRLEAWIRERPEQWLWVHRRWSDG